MNSPQALQGDPHFNVGGKTCRHHIGPFMAWWADGSVIVPVLWEMSSVVNRRMVS